VRVSGDMSVQTVELYVRDNAGTFVPTFVSEYTDNLATPDWKVVA
jgi:hypothetical protein